MKYMKCDGLPDPVCVRELNTYLSLWQEDDSREDIDAVLERTQVMNDIGTIVMIFCQKNLFAFLSGKEVSVPLLQTLR